MIRKSIHAWFGLAFFLVLAPSASLSAQEERALGWSDVAELTFVLTQGNASSSTFGLKNTAEYVWPRSTFKLDAGGVRTESGMTTRFATGTPDDFTVRETTETETTAESYFLKGRIDHDVREATFVYAGAGWDRNTFAGIQNRYGFVSGAGRSWFNEETRRFKTDLGLTYTIQDDVVENPDLEDSWIGLRGSYDYLRTLTESTDLTSVLVVDQNLNATEDLRADWTNALAVAMSERLALKTSVQLLYDNEPALSRIPLGDPADEVWVLTPLDKVDTVFTVAIVAKF